MKETTWSFYRASDGLFISRRCMTNNQKSLKLDTPPDCIAIKGRYDRFRQRVDIATGQVIVDESLGAERDRERQRDAAVQAIAELEQKQLRPLRELAVDAGNAEARRRVEQIEAQISTLRGSL
jgi:hypothetical protein